MQEGKRISRTLAHVSMQQLSKEVSMASYRSEHERSGTEGIPSLEEMEVGKPVGAILPMSEHAQVALRDSIELIDYLMNQAEVTWN
jgi:hypothetical protein